MSRAEINTQLDLTETWCLARYRDSETRWDHTAEIQRQYGYRSFRLEALLEVPDDGLAGNTVLAIFQDRQG